MPSTKNPKSRGARGKKTKEKKQKNNNLPRSSEADLRRLQKAISRSTELNRENSVTADSQRPGASSSTTLPAEQQDNTPVGVVRVSLDSDSDHALSSSSEDSDAKAGTTTVSDPAHTNTQNPELSLTDSQFTG